MPYITREDGEHFVIPSYRDVLSAKQKNALKKEILLLSQSYGEYITMQKKGTAQYEVAFSPDTGYLLGESIWQYFKRPEDMIYCEAIPNTTEALLVIVKNSSVYLDGSFPIDSIPEELIIFLTQENHFEIYVYGDVPISERSLEGKFSFEAKSVKSFTHLDKPVFPTLPLLKIYQLQMVEPVLKANGIGVFPVKQVLTLIAIVGAFWMLWSYWKSRPVQPIVMTQEVNPYQSYYDALISPAPDAEIRQFLDKLKIFFTMPGWNVTTISYAQGGITAAVSSAGGSMEGLFAWGKENYVNINLQQKGVSASTNISLARRPIPKTIYPLKEVLGEFVDRLAKVYPGNHLQLGEFQNKGVFTDVAITINFDAVSPLTLLLISDQFKDLPLQLQSVNVTIDMGNVTGSIIIDALGT